MATKQAESQQNDERSNESVICAQKQSSCSGRNIGVSVKQQTGSESTDEINQSIVPDFKYVNRELTLEMSQYRTEDISGHSAGEAKSPRELQQDSITKSESLDITSHPSHSFTSSQVRSEYSEEYAAKSLSNEYSVSKQASTEYSSKPITEFSATKQIEVYHTKQLHAEADRVHQSDVDENYAISKMETRHSHSAPGSIPFSGQPRFLSGQSISQTTGPTPTLNQLLQSSSPVHRFHSTYSSIGSETYQQPWPMQRPSVVPPVYPQPSQRPPQTSSPRLHHGPGGSSSPTSLSYQSYNQRFTSPGRSHSPYSHHQMNSYTVPAGHGSNLYGDQRGWNQTSSNPPVPPPSNQANSSSQSPQRALSQSPAPPSSASPQPQTSSQSQNFHNIQQRSTTPNTQGIDSGELSGQNSNDSSNGPAGPTTPNSQGMRPTPSPTGSTGSRSMSPAVGQQNVQMPPRPSSGQSDSSGPARMSLSPLATQGPSPHVHNYKTNNSGQNAAQSSSNSNLSNINSISGGMGYVNASTNQAIGYSSQGNYSTRPHLQFSQTYATGNNSQTPTNQYQANRSNNMVQYSTYTHKVGFTNLSSGITSSSASNQTYNATGASSNIAQSNTSTISGLGNMGPPTGSMGPPPSSPNHLSSPMPPPSTTPNSHTACGPTSISHNPVESNIHAESSNDTSIINNIPVSTIATITTSNTVTSVVTTGPDGTSLDEGSQQSTLSNASAASGEDSAFTPKVRKELMGYHTHTATPQGTIPSPGATSINSVHEDYPDINSPGWPRTPASPVYNSHVSQDPYRSKKSDSLSKLYEMDDSIERRTWLDKLVSFMEDRRTPITSCPTISKNPLDLFRLYLYVKERGGFMEVTKNKTWKDIAGLLGIGASSSAAYTLRKHYTKHLLAYECHFDRGGVDPQPIINQVEAGSKKKVSKGTSSVPSPGSSNSQDSFPAVGSNSASIDGYGNYQSNYSGNAAAGTQGDYNTPPPRPPSQSNTTTHQQSMQQGNYQNPASFQSYSQDQYIRPQASVITQQNEFSQPYSARTHYPSYVGDVDRNYTSGNMTPNNGSGQDIYARYTVGNQQSSSYSSGASSSNRTTYSIATPSHSTNTQQTVVTQQISSQPQSSGGTTYACPQDYYRQDQGTYGSSIGSQIYANSGAVNKNMPPPPPGPQQPRRHPDFIKEQQYTAYNPQRASYPGWPVGTTNQYTSGTSVRMQYSNQHPSTSSQQHQQTQQTQPSSGTSVSSTISMNSVQWNNQQNTRSSIQTSINSLVHAPSPWDHRYSHSSTLYSTPVSHQNQLGMTPVINQQSITKREMTFPVDSIEAITPLLYKRKKLTRSDIAPVEAWRIMMALRSGLLAESCWALDVLNILLFDDSTVHFFGLAHLPGLLDVLLEHFSRSLSDMFDSSLINEDRYYQRSFLDRNIDLGAVIRPIDPEDRTKILSSSNYTFLSRRGKPVKIVPRDDDIFILDNRRSWDYQDNDTEIEPWHVDGNAINYIVTCFESQVHDVSFTSHIKTEKLSILHNDVEDMKSKDALNCYSLKESNENYDNKSQKCNSFKEQKDMNSEPKQQQDKKKKMKTLSDVLSRIKKEPIEMNDLTRELFEKKYDGSKKENETNLRSINNLNDYFEVEVLKNNVSLNTKQQNGLNDFNSTSLSTSVISNIEQKKEFQINSINEKRNICDDEKENRKFYSLEDEVSPKLKVRDPAGTLKRRRISDYEDESYSRDEASLYLVTETQDNLARRCVCLSTILRNLTFIPGNEVEFARNVTFLSLLGKLLLLHHEHPTRAQKTRNYDREEDADFADSCSSLQGENEWWWDFLYHIRENVLVMAANIAGHMDLSHYPEEISRPVLDGLLHWAVCPAAHGQDPFPTVSLNSSLSPQRLALEALCKLCVTESNVDLVVATPPYSRLQKLCSVLSRLLCRSEEQVLREFGINLLHFLSAADSGVARTIALQTPCVALLVAFIEQAENSALGVANQLGIAALRDNPESMGTSLDMLRRAAGTLLNLSRHPDNRTLLLQHESRLLALVMSQILDQQVAAIVARVLFQCSRGTT